MSGLGSQTGSQTHDDPANLRAACAPCNYGNGARMVNARRRAGTAKRDWPPRPRIKPLSYTSVLARLTGRVTWHC
jgi:hypothetical protein